MDWRLKRIKKERDVLLNTAWKNKFCLPALVLLLSGCGLTQAVTDGTVSATKSIFHKKIKDLHMDFTAREALNTDASEASSSSQPVLVRVYQLRDDKNFQKTVYQQLAGEGDDALKDDLLASRNVVIKPGTAMSLDMPMEKDAKFVAVVGLFRHPDMDKNQWRLVIKREELDPDKARVIELGNNSLTLQPVKD
ncbi:type VI secretion system lipoprotein TssJ [Rahnella aquatilis]|nr:type VI secretion system lipoprotein TssJ [Rahnella aquatilis]